MVNSFLALKINVIILLNLVIDKYAMTLITIDLLH